MPVHPRGKARMTEIGLFDHDNMHAVEPLGYLEFLGLVRRSALVVTDSGGIQEETTVLGVPCLTLRPNTERPVTITHGDRKSTRLNSSHYCASPMPSSPLKKKLYCDTSHQ